MWSGSPAVSRLKTEHGLKTSDDVQGWALNKMAGLLAARGIRPAAWEEAAKGSNGGIENNALLFSWTGQQAGIDAAKAGYDIIMSPAQHVDLEMAHTDHEDDWGAAWAAFVSLEDSVAWSVIPDKSIATRVIGVEGTFGPEFTTEDHEMKAMLAPRILGVALMGWSREHPAQTASFGGDACAFCEILTNMNWTWNASCFD